MAWRNTAKEYGESTKLLHWVGGIAFLWALLLAATFWPLDPSRPADVVYFFKWVHLHKSLGVTVLIVALVRLYWRSQNVIPELPGTMPPWQIRIAHVTHWTLYGFMIVMPLTGLIGNELGNFTFKFFYLFKVPHFVEKNEVLGEWVYDVHVYLGWIGAVVIALHIAAALVHHFHYRDKILIRMIPAKLSGEIRDTP